ncbi:hypothetical protein GCM10025867_48860 (plasmid) [Frondihabitans sucicola]|uniref:Alternate-type signal peptide domain-containing protein n=1 Tax=Frondihabitans sucicola TaxID=1268041 RepID=A0ABM8GVZ0_9MICO|nr:hypothetical protein [Frondihabitans sucicola]BDZ52645.1 hypothetical protein GCM10025867_48860 [Frondihabitans sucicola]
MTTPKTALLIAGVSILGVGALGFGAIGGGAALAAPQLVVTNPGHATTWHPAKLPGFDSQNIRAGGTVTEQFAIENTGKADMALDMRFTPAPDTAKYVELTLRDLTANKTLYTGPVGDGVVKAYDVGHGAPSRRVFQITLTFNEGLPAELREHAASPDISIEAERAKPHAA